MSRIRPRPAVATILAAAVMAAGPAVPAGARATTAPVPRTGSAGVLPLLGGAHAVPRAAAHGTPVPVTAPLPPSQCEAKWRTPCYDARLLREIYGLGRRDEGQGATVALIMPYNDPVMRHDLDTYARQARLPVPDLHISEIGHPVTADPDNLAQTAAVQEGELDAQMIVAIAPRVRLDYIETQTDFSLSPDAFSYYSHILATLPARRPRVDAVSLSLGYAEQNYAEENGTAAGDAVIRNQAAALNAAVRAGITVTVSAGDTGSAGVNLAGTGVYKRPAVLFPASDPLVIAASGTEVYAGDRGGRTRPDVVWSDDGDHGATGGGQSRVFTRPSYQDRYAAVTGNHRGVGDVAMDGATETPVWMYTSRYNLFAGQQATGWQLVAGTSVSSPLFTAIAVDAAAIAGHPLGDIHQALYTMALHPAATGIQPVTRGCNPDYGVRGYCASARPWSLPDGTGTVANGERFIVALAAAASRR
jgi:subtilase family serine protease